MLNLVTIPSPANLMTADQTGIATDTVSNSMADMAQGLFTEMWPYVLAVVGFILGALILRYLVFGGFAAGVKKLVGKGRRGGRRR